MRLSAQEAQAWAEDILKRCGALKGEATIISELLVDAELRGYRLMGLARLPRLVEFLRTTQRSPITTEKETAISAVLDGNNNLGYVTARKMADIAIAKASRHDVAVVAAHNCVYTGRNGYYVELIAQQGLVGLMMNNFSPLVAPWGSNEAIFGTNPFSVGMPTSEDPFVFDMGTSSIMEGDLRLRAIEQRALPEGLAFDSEGHPTTDPEKALEGAVTAFGEHRGSGLALVIQAFGILANSPPVPERPEESGVFMMALNPELLISRPTFTSRLGALLDTVRGARPNQQIGKVRVPGDRARDEKKRNMAEGIELSEHLVKALRAL